jgi:hypothetical protein
MGFVIHTIGLEGCGHHGLEPIIVDILRRNKNYRNKGVLNNTLLQMCRNCDNLNTFENKIKQYLKKEFVIYTDDSYPSGNNKTIPHQKNIVKMYNIISKCVDIKLVYLKRNIYNIINSKSHRKNWDIIEHTKIISKIKNYIENQIQVLRDNNVNVIELNYEDIDNEKGQKIISDLLNVDINIVKDTVNARFTKSRKDYKKLLDHNIIEQIDTILNE